MARVVDSLVVRGYVSYVLSASVCWTVKELVSRSYPFLEFTVTLTECKMCVLCKVKCCRACFLWGNLLQT